MNQISHKQALQWIDRRLDGFLTDNQLSLLDKHLQSCDSCRLHAEEMESLPAHLRNEFRARWDEKAGPSQKVLQDVTAKARNIRAANGLSSGIRWFAGVATLALLGLTINFFISRLQGSFTKTEAGKGPVNASLSADDRLLVFHSDENGNYDIYSMYADGSGLTNLTDHPANDKHPFWSPDGTRIAFESDRSGTVQIFLMNADGSGLIQLTGDEKQHMFLGPRDPWSPDGTSLLIGENTPSIDQPENQIWTLYAASIDGQAKASLIEIIHTAPTSFPWLEPFWAPGGQHIAFTMDDPATEVHTSQLYTVDVHGGNLTNTTSSLSANENLEREYYWSRDGQSIFFLAYHQVDSQKGQWVVYEFDLADNQLTEKSDSGGDWWEGTSFSLVYDPDYTTIQTAFASMRKTSLRWLRVDGSSSALQPFEKCEFTEASDLDGIDVVYQRSLNGNLIIVARCPHGNWWLYRANHDGTVITQLLNTPIVAPDLSLPVVAWSPDDRYITFFTGTSDNLTDVYLLDVEAAIDDPSIRPVKVRTHTGSEFYSVSWQPVWNKEVVEAEPSPTDSPVATDLLTLTPMDTPVATDAPTLVLTDTPIATNTPTLEPTQPINSQEHLIAFASANENSNPDIYTMRPDGSELTNLTNHSAHDINPYWSPDGRRIAFESDRAGFTNIFLMDADGSNMVQLTNGEAQHYFSNTNPWSSDGSKLLFAEWTPEGEKWMLSVIGVDGQNQTLLTEVPNTYSNPSWSPDGQRVAFLADDPQNLGGNRLYVVDADGQNRRELTQSFQVDEQLSSMEYDWSSDGQSIFFISILQTTDPSWTVYEAKVADNSLITHVTTKTPLFDWWNDISVVSPFIWKRSDEMLSTLDPYNNCQQMDAAQSGSYMKRSPNGDWLISAYCPNGDVWLYWVRSDGTLNRQLLDVPIPSEQRTFSDFVWSPDEKFVALNVFSNNHTDMYILDMEASLNDPSIQPLKITVSGGNLFSNVSWRPLP